MKTVSDSSRGWGSPSTRWRFLARCIRPTWRALAAAGAVAETDALVTNTPGVYLCVTVADCVPILIHDPGHRAVAAVHAGWRGSAAGILLHALNLMRSAFGTNPGDLRAYIGPSAGGCCYEVGAEVADHFRPGTLRRVRERQVPAEPLGLQNKNPARGWVPESQILLSERVLHDPPGRQRFTPTAATVNGRAGCSRCHLLASFVTQCIVFQPGF